MKNWLKSNPVGIGGILIALAAIALATWFFFLQQKETSLRLVLTSHVNLVSDEVSPSEKIAVLFEGREVPDLWFASFRLDNNGDTPISRGDFDRPITLQLTGGEFLDLILGDSLPLQLKPKLVQISDDTIEIQPTLLNSGDSIFFSLFATTSMETLVPEARIAGVDRLDLVSSIEAQEAPFPWLRFSAYGVMVAVIGFFVGMVYTVFLKFASIRQTLDSELRPFIEKARQEALLESVRRELAQQSVDTEEFRRMLDAREEETRRRSEEEERS